MKILIISQEYYPKGSGIANVVHNLKKSMETSGNDVDICSPTGPDYKIGKADLLIEKAGGLGIAYFWYKVGKLLKKLEPKYDLIYLHNPMLFTKITSRKIFCVVHTLYYSALKEYAWKDIGKIPYYLFMTFVEHVGYLRLRKFKFIVTSPKTIKELRHYGIRSKMPIIYNGYDFSATSKKLPKERTQFIKSSKDIKFLFVGRLTRQKNLFRMLDMFKQLERINPKYLLVLISGGGELQNKLKNYIKKNSIKKAVIIDKVSHEELLGLYGLFDYTISSSYYEGFPLTLSESLASGLVPILSPIEIFRHITKQIHAGAIIDFSQNPRKAAAKIDQYCNSIDLKKESAKIKKLSKKLFDWNAIAKEYIDATK